MRILVVEDDPGVRALIRKTLERNDYRVLEASNGHEALSVAEMQELDLVLSDLVMPGMNGFQATRELSRDPRTARIPVLMVTTKGDETDRIWGMRQGAADYLVKPITEAQLVERVKAVLEG